MRYLHPVQAHERFLSSGSYRFSKDGERLRKSEAWTAHGHPDGEDFRPRGHGREGRRGQVDPA